MNTEKHNLLILGAGGHGQVVAEIAREMDYFDSIHFLDDCICGPDIVGASGDYQKFAGKYSDAFVALGNPELREAWLVKVSSLYSIPVLVHPRAWISKSACIESGTVIEAMACINANVVVRQGVIVGLGALVDHNAEVGSYTHLDCGSVIPPAHKVPSRMKVPAGMVFSCNH